MAALSCNVDDTKRHLRSLGAHQLEIAVINHAKQTVVSGPEDDIKRLGPVLAAQGIGLTTLSSPFPFHSSHLASAVAPFRESLSAFTFGSARIPVYHCTERALFETGEDLPDILSRQFARLVDFQEIISELRLRIYTRC